MNVKSVNNLIIEFLQYGDVVAPFRQFEVEIYKRDKEYSREIAKYGEIQRLKINIKEFAVLPLEFMNLLDRVAFDEKCKMEILFKNNDNASVEFIFRDLTE